MGILGLILILAGLVVMLIYSIQLLIIAFREHILWGIGSLFIGLVGLIFVIMHWDIAKGPFLKSLVGFALFFIGLELADS